MVGKITLRQISRDTVRALCRLKVMPGQLTFTVSPAISIAEAAYFPEYSIRAVYAGETPIGILVLNYESDIVIIERLFIDAMFQNRGVGKEVVRQLAENYDNLYVKVVNIDIPGNPIGFWTKIGFGEPQELDNGHVLLSYTR